MRVQRGIAGSSSQIFIISVGDMVAIFELITLGQSEINDVDFAGFLPPSNYEVIRFDIPMKITLVVYELYPLYHLMADHEGAL